MGHEPKWLRQTGRILASLVQADEDDMADFVRERLDGADVPPERAADARALLVRIGESLRDPTPERMMSLEYTRRVLEDWKAGEEKSPAAPSAAPPVAPSPPIPSPPASPQAAPSVSPAPARAPAAPSPPVIFIPPATGGSGPSPWAKGDASAPDPMAMTADGATPHAGHNPLPFKEGAVATPPKKLSLEPHAAMGQTAPVSKKRSKNVLPFGGKPPPLTLEQYAYFCVERALWPAHQVQTCAKYGVELAYEATLHEEYRQVLASDRALQAKFNELREQARSQLSS